MTAQIFDSLKLAREKGCLSGRLDIASLTRLHDLIQPDGSLLYRVEGMLDGQGRPGLRVEVTGRVKLQCQRCLGDLDQALSIDTVLRLAPAEEVAAQASGKDEEVLSDPDEPDCIAANAESDLAALVEEEVLLALPAYPRHEAACGAAGLATMAATDSTYSAFSALAALKRK